MTLVAQLAGLRDALTRMVRELDLHAPHLSGSWQYAIRELDRMVASGAELEELAGFADTTLKSIGVGMGSLRDTFISHEFERVLEEAADLMAQVADRWDSTPANPNILRRHLVALENELLGQGMTSEAALLRDVLGAELKVEKAAQLIIVLSDRRDLTDRMRASLEAARETLQAITRAAAADHRPA